LRTVPGVTEETLFPAVDLEGAPLWGFTYRLVSDWLGLESVGDPAAAVVEFLRERGMEVSEWKDRVAEARGAGR
jgi:TorA maturation chaperone TorD